MVYGMVHGAYGDVSDHHEGKKGKELFFIEVNHVKVSKGEKRCAVNF